MSGAASKKARGNLAGDCVAPPNEKDVDVLPEACWMASMARSISQKSDSGAEALSRTIEAAASSRPSSCSAAHRTGKPRSRMASDKPVSAAIAFSMRATAASMTAPYSIRSGGAGAGASRTPAGAIEQFRQTFSGGPTVGITGASMAFSRAGDVDPPAAAFERVRSC
jgi:hypothetical protein